MKVHFQLEGTERPICKIKKKSKVLFSLSNPLSIRVDLFSAHHKCLCSHCSGQSKLCCDPSSPLCRIQVLHQSNLIASRRPLPRSNGTRRQKVLPDLSHKLASPQRAPAIHPSKLTLNQRAPYFSSTFFRFPNQFLYHLHTVAE
jgi:hypothetical protein